MGVLSLGRSRFANSNGSLPIRQGQVGSFIGPSLQLSRTEDKKKINNFYLIELEIRVIVMALKCLYTGEPCEP
jgi:hypothetical protein